MHFEKNLRDYYKIEHKKEILSKEYGFITYHVNPDDSRECFVGDIYINPDFRNNRLTHELMHEVEAIAKEKNCEFLTANTFFHKGEYERYTRNVRLMIDAGFVIYKVEQNDIIWMKLLEGK